MISDLVRSITNGRQRQGGQLPASGAVGPEAVAAATSRGVREGQFSYARDQSSKLQKIDSGCEDCSSPAKPNAIQQAGD